MSLYTVLAVSKFFKMLHFSYDFLGKAVLLLKDFKSLLSFLTNFTGKRTGYTINQNIILWSVRKYGYEDESKKKQNINYVL